MHKIPEPPKKPGVYQFKNSVGTIIYIGKAKNLSNRVRSYFGGKPTDPKTRQLVSNISDAEYILTDNELEALILESILIKKHKPRYNIRLRDDKNYLFIKIDYSLPIPQIYTVRKKDERHQKSAKYFGPYTSSLNVRNTLHLVKKIFPYCLAKEVSTRACFNYQLHRCPGPCIGEISLEKYRQGFVQIELFLQGRTGEIQKSLGQEMRRASNFKKFERAAVLRDQLNALRDLSQSQKVINIRPYNQDFISLARKGNNAAINVFLVRDGKLVGKETMIIDNVENSEDEKIVSTFMERYYLDASNLPKEIFTSFTLENKIILEKLVTQKRYEILGKKIKVKIRQPYRGTAKKLIKLGQENALNFLEQQLAKFEKEEILVSKSLEFLKKALDLSDKPVRIEAFDISNIQGTAAVGSMVVFENGKPKKDQYRKFKIKTKSTPDDYAMMTEILRRRLNNNWPKPDLWIIDGGRGQLNIALKVLKQRRTSIPTIALAKSRTNNPEDRELPPYLREDGLEERHEWREKILLPKSSKPIILDEGHPAKSLIQRLRDEAHRFAITYHRNLRSRSLLNA